MRNMAYQNLTVKMAIELAAPHTWPASVMPVLIGITLSVALKASPSWVICLILLAICVLMQSSVNTFNDYFDYVKGLDSKEDNLDPTDAVLLYNNIDPKSALKLAIGYLAGAFVLGIYIIYLAGWIPLVIALVGALIVVLYSAGKTPISSLPIGEAVSGIVMGGLITLAVVDVITGTNMWIALLWSVPQIIGIGLIMMTNNTCDIEKDLRTGRRTLPNTIGRDKAVVLYRAFVLVWIISIFLYAFSLHPAAGACAALMLIPGYMIAFRYLLHSPVAAQTRIAQRKGILKANLTGAAICLAVIAAVSVIR